MPNYRDAGVDFESIGKFRNKLISALKFKGSKYRMASEIGHYAGLVEFRDGYLALHTDGVGTKTIYALKFDYFDEIGYDLIGMNVNDIVSIGAEPIAMVDYIASSIFSGEIGEKIGRSLNSASEKAGVALVGGETASVPDIVKGIDVSGTVMGYLKKDRVIDGSKIEEGDVIIGLESSGVHSNGFSLVRKIYDNLQDSLFDDFNGIPLWKALMKGTIIYAREIIELTKRIEVHGLAHITGGGVRNLVRLSKKKFLIDNFEVDPLFLKIKDDGNLDYREMFETFNMGYGYMIISSKKDCEEIIDYLRDFNPRIIGRVMQGEGVELKEFGIKYSGYY